MESSKIDNLSSKINTVIGELLKKADSTCKRVLTLFDPSKDSDVNILKLKNVNRTELDALGRFFNIPLFQDTEQKKKVFSSKKKLAKRIVMEITALYPTMCSECNEEYRVMHGSQPNARCWICLQGSHNCDEVTARIEIYQNLPTVLNGMVWLCSDCLTLNNPLNEERGTISGLNTPRSGLNTPRFDTPNYPRNITNETPVLPKVDDPTEMEPDLVVENLSQKLSQELSQELSQKLESVLDEQQKAESKPNTCNHVCPRLMEGTCPHGVSGKKAADGKEKCPLFHPKRCRRFMAFYTHETKGCTEGENCDLLHVNLCKSSIRNKRCFDVSCKAMHLVGTKRPKSMLDKKKKDSASRPQNDNQQNTNSRGYQTKPGNKSAKEKKNKKNDLPPNPKPTADPPSDPSSFLDMASCLEEIKLALVEEITMTVQREIKAVRDDMGQYKEQLEMLKTVINPQLSHYNQAMAYYGLYKPTPFEMPQYNRMWMQRDRTQSQNLAQNTTPIPPAFC